MQGDQMRLTVAGLLALPLYFIAFKEQLYFLVLVVAILQVMGGINTPIFKKKRN